MPANLLYKNISSTYQGLLHAQGATLPTVGQINVTDGAGEGSSLSLGRSGNGVTITGSTVVDDVYADSLTTTTLAASTLVVQGDVGVVARNTPKAWVCFYGSDGSITASYNVASVVPTALIPGQYTINFTTPLSSNNYAVNVNIEYENAGAGAPAMVCSYMMNPPIPSVSAFKIQSYRLMAGTTTAVQFNPEKVSVVVYQ